MAPSLRPHRENNFNLLRLMLALMVLLAHAPELVDGNRQRELLTRAFHTLSFGELAVDLFFVISGYLIVDSWQRHPSPVQFMKSRILRIFPGFIVASLVCALLVGPLGAAGASSYFAGFDAAAFTGNMLLLQPPHIPPVFQGQPHAVVNGSMWTIGLEFACYLLVLAMGLAGAVRHRQYWLAAAGLSFLLLAAQRMQVPLPGVPDHAPRLFMHFIAGGCFFLFRQRIRLGPRGALMAAVLLLAGLNSWRLSEFAIATAGAYLAFFFTYARIPALMRFNALPDVSYGVYLYGWPVQKLFLWYQPAMSPWVLFGVSALAAMALGTVSWYAVEKPALRLKAVSLASPPMAASR